MNDEKTRIRDGGRREAAERLRALDVTDIEENGRIIDSPKYVGLLLMRILDKTCDYRPGLSHFPSYFSAQTVVALFADLIDRPTCRNTSGYRDVFLCSECGVKLELIAGAGNGHGGVFHVPFQPIYCPSCGAEVIE